MADTPDAGAAGAAGAAEQTRTMHKFKHAHNKRKAQDLHTNTLHRNPPEGRLQWEMKTLANVFPYSFIYAASIHSPLLGTKKLSREHT